MSANADAAIIYGTLGQSVSVPSTGVNNSTKVFPFIAGNESLALRLDNTHGSGTAKLLLNSFHLVTSGGNSTARKFALGASIGPGLNTGAHGGTFLFKHTTGGAKIGPFSGVGTGFAAFKTGGGDYGWIHIATSDLGTPGFINELQVLDFAYNDVAGAAINVGDGIPQSGAPEPGTAALGILASGAIGLAAWRRRRSEAAK